MPVMPRAPLDQRATTWDYFRLIAARARFAAAEGNYAISAALVVRDGSTEAIFEGWNTLFAEHQPSGHAEMNAIRLAHAVSALPDAAAAALVERAQRAEAIHVRPRGGPGGEQTLYTTLEPCPMCTVCLINAGVDRVVIAAADPPSGTLERSRLERLPDLWPQLAAAGGLQVSFCQSEDAGDPDTYLPADLHDELLGRFAESRSALDRELGVHGVLDFKKAGAQARALLHDT